MGTYVAHNTRINILKDTILTNILAFSAKLDKKRSCLSLGDNRGIICYGLANSTGVIDASATVAALKTKITTR